MFEKTDSYPKKQAEFGGSKTPKKHPATFDLAKATGVEKLLRNIRQGQLAEGHLLLLKPS
jgi:hypothetical protein